MWFTILESEVIRLYLLENELVNEKSYQKIILYFVFPRLLHNRELMTFQQERAPEHFSDPVRSYFNMKLSNRWTGKAEIFMVFMLARHESFCLLFVVLREERGNP